MKEQQTVKNAKQNYKRNESKYGEFTAFEVTVLDYYLTKDEAKSLLTYIKKITNNENEIEKMEKYIIEEMN